MAAREVLHPGAEEEAQKDGPRDAEHHDKGHQGPARPANHQMAEVGPVAWRLFPGQRAQAQIGRRGRAWPVAGDDGAEPAGSAAIAAFARHRVEPAGGQSREPGQHRADERQRGVDLQWPRRPDARQASLGQHPGNGFGMPAQLPGDRADAPLFDVVVAQDLRLQVRGNSHGWVLCVGFEGPGAAENLAAQALNSAGHNTGNAIADGVQAADCRAAMVARPPPPEPRPAQHPIDAGVNRDASRYFAAPGSGASAPHVSPGRDGSPGSAAPLPAATVGARGARTQRNRCGPDRNGGR